MGGGASSETRTRKLLLSPSDQEIDVCRISLQWGNPNEDKYFDYMLSYSPYDNVRAQPYPHLLITAGLHDPRVPFWEPAKWASKLRTLKTSDTQVVVKMDLDSGHFSASDRYKGIREKAYDQAFVLSKLGLADAPKK